MYEIIETAHVLKTPGHTLEIYKNVWIPKKKMYGCFVFPTTHTLFSESMGETPLLSPLQTPTYVGTALHTSRM